jgi:hypothetical protein
MSEINHFKVLYLSRLYDRWYSVDLVIGGWYDSWWCGYLIYQEKRMNCSRS